MRSSSALVVLLSGCAGAPTAPAGSAGPALGERVYRRACAACHGESGDGRGPGAAWLDPAPRDFTEGTFKFRSTPSGALPSDEDLVRTVSKGLAGTWMPAWERHLAPAEIEAVVAHLKTLSPRFDEEGPPEQAPGLDEEPPDEDAGLVERGREIYEAMRCGECHGPAGRGDGPAAPALVDGRGRPIRPLDFTVGLYKGGSDARSVHRTFLTGLDGTPMPSYADALPDPRDRWALVFYVLALSREPAWWERIFVRPTPWE